MGRKEAPLIRYYNSEQRFAELLNGWMFRGKHVLDPEDITKEDRRFSRQTEKESRTSGERYRDIFKKIHQVGVRLLIGAELQSYIHYMMPLRIQEYDTLAYLYQAEQLRLRHKRLQDLKKEEYLSGCKKEDRLLPVVTLVLYFGEKPWDGPRSMHEMLDMGQIPEELKEYVADYPLHVLDVCHTPDERLMEFPPDIRFMFLFLKNQKNKSALWHLKDIAGLESVAEDTYEVIAEYTGEPELLEWKDQIMSEEGGVNMCQGIRELVADGEMRGKTQAICAIIEEYLRDGLSKEAIMEKITRVFKLSQEEAESCCMQVTKL